MDSAQLQALLGKLGTQDVKSLIQGITDEIEHRKCFYYKPYPKQQEFHEAGRTHRERLFCAGNQCGKTLAGSMEVAYHATGLYPNWWTGQRFPKPTVSWCAGITSESTRDTVQRLLLGRTEPWGAGSIPRANIISTSRARGVDSLIDTILVKHASGGVSTISLKSYEKGREKWQGETLDFVWFDEEPDEEIYSEGMARTMATHGIMFMTFTPLKGRTKVVRRFFEEQDNQRHIVQMTIDDAEHFTPEQREQEISRMRPHERQARAKGIPTLGSGAIFPIDEATILQEPFDIPKHFFRIGGLDFGWDHPTAAVELAIDRDKDCVYVTKTHRLAQATPVIHAASLRPWGLWLPWSWPHDGLQHDKGSGVNLAAQYAEQGLNMLPERATFLDGTWGVEAGISDMLLRMQTNRWKVFKHLENYLQEFRNYHRDEDGRIVKENDDLISASRYALMMQRFAAQDGGWSKALDYGTLNKMIV